ncbi:ATP-binding protein [Aneurinibacillus terranovensis]|uniref:ATP-binding protein n=1 Tax=Aneurinibacillus terranovensis TaxID=278991 RepID=UPI0005521B7D|nr:ATP-binding protein [Aneurinibacillus terranovensis]
MRQGSSQQLYSAFPTRIGSEKLVFNMAEYFLSPYHLLNEQMEDIKTILSEACLNAIEHGQTWNSPETYAVELKILNNSLWIRVFDHRQEILDKENIVQRFRTIASVFQNHFETRGWGLQIIDHLADSWDFGMENGRTFIEIQVILKHGKEGR